MVVECLILRRRAFHETPLQKTVVKKENPSRKGLESKEKRFGPVLKGHFRNDLLSKTGRREGAPQRIGG